MRRLVHYRHWLPILTFCPVNGLPDFIYVTVSMVTKGEPLDLYKVRKQLRVTLSGRKLYMEDVAQIVSKLYPSATVTVSLMFNRHQVIVEASNDHAPD